MTDNELPLIITIDATRAKGGADQIIQTLTSIKEAAAASGRTMGSGFKQGTTDASSHVTAFYKQQERMSKAFVQASIEDVNRKNSQIESLSKSHSQALIENARRQQQQIEAISKQGTADAHVTAFRKSLADLEKAQGQALEMDKKFNAKRFAEEEKAAQNLAALRAKQNATSLTPQGLIGQQLSGGSARASALAFGPDIYQAAGLKSPQDRIAGMDAVRRAQSELRKEFINGRLSHEQYSLSLDEAQKKLNLFAFGNTRARSALHQMTASLASMTFELTGAIYGLTVIAGILGGPAILGINFLRTIEDAKLGMTGILLSMGEINGKALTLPQALSVANDVTKNLADNSIKYAVSLEELVTTFRSILAPGLAAGMNLDQIARVATIGAVAVKSIGLDSRQVVQEIRDLVAGGIQAASSTLATSLSVKDSDVKKWREAGTLFQELEKRLSGFATAATERQNTLSGAFDILKIKITRLFADSKAFDGLKNALISVSNYIGVINSETNQIDFNPQLVKNVQLYWDVLKGVGSALTSVVKFMVEWSTVTNLVAGAYIANKLFGSAISLIETYILKLEAAAVATLGLGAASTATATASIGAATSIAAAGNTLAKGSLAARGGLYGMLLWGVYELATFAVQSKWVEDNIFATFMKIGEKWDEMKKKLGTVSDIEAAQNRLTKLQSFKRSDFKDDSFGTGDSKYKANLEAIEKYKKLVGSVGSTEKAATKPTVQANPKDVTSAVAAGQAAGRVQTELEKLNDPEFLKKKHENNLKGYLADRDLRLKSAKDEVSQVKVINDEYNRLVIAENKRFGAKDNKKADKLAKAAAREQIAEIRDVYKSTQIEQKSGIELEKINLASKLIKLNTEVATGTLGVVDAEEKKYAISLASNAVQRAILENTYNSIESQNSVISATKNNNLIREQENKLNAAGNTLLASKSEAQKLTEESTLAHTKAMKAEAEAIYTSKNSVIDLADGYNLERISIGKTVLEVEKLKNAREKELALRNRLKIVTSTGDVIDNPNISSKQKQQVIDEINQTEELKNIQADRQNSFVGGWEKAFDSYSKSANNAAEQASKFFTDAFKKMEDAIVQFAMTGKASFGDLAKSVVEGLIRIQVQKATAGIGESLFTFAANAFAGGSGASSTGTASYDSFVAGSGNYTANAKGGAYNSPSLSSYSSGIYNTPQMFAKGGIFAEAGPEAIMPLHRGPDGSLGVKNSGGSSGSGDVQVNVVVNIDKNGDSTTDVKDNAQGGKALGDMIGNTVRGIILTELRPGGLLGVQR